MTRKQKAETKPLEAESPKKPKPENGNGNENGKTNDKSSGGGDITAEYEDLCRATEEHLSADQMRQILEDNGLALDSSASASAASQPALIRKWYI